MAQIGAYLALAIAMLVMGSAIVSNKAIVDVFPVFMATEGRLVLACLLQLFLLRLIGEPFPHFTRREKQILFWQAFLGVFLYSICFMVGLKYTTALETSIFTSFIPAAGVIIAVLIFREKMSWNQSTGVLLTILGTMLVNIAGSVKNPEFAHNHLVGNILILLSSFCQAVFVTFGKLLPARIHFLALGAAVSGLGALMFLPLTVYDLLRYNISSAGLANWALIAYNGLFCTGLGVILMNYANRRISATVVSVFTALTPVSAILLSWMLLHEPISWYHPAGMSIILAGILLSMRKRPVLI